MIQSSYTVLIRTRRLGPGTTEERKDVLVRIFGAPANASTQGTLSIASTSALVVSSRTYNLETSTRTYRASYPALIAADRLQYGGQGVLPGVAKNAWSRTNVGIVNLSSRPCEAKIAVLGTNGRQLGNDSVITVDPSRWRQANDTFGASGAPTADLAYAMVTLQTVGCTAWACGRGPAANRCERKSHMPNPFERGPEHDPHERTCPMCNGRGTVKNDRGEWVTCPQCGGRGTVLIKT